jgi:hypothetical protein
MAKTEAAANKAPAQPGESPASTAQRKIPGNLPYMTSSGTLKKALDRLIDAQQPPRYNADFLENILSLTGGGARATVPILKKMGFISSDGAPTALYSKFRTDSGRGAAALQGLQLAFAEIFKRSTYAHNATDAKLKDIIVEITGLVANDPVAVAIRSTFNVVKSYVPANMEIGGPASEAAPPPEDSATDRQPPSPPSDTASEIRLAYNINIVLPETSDLNVLNAIFRSIKENLMR